MGHRTVIVFALSLAAPHASLSAEKHLAGEFGAFGGGVFGTGNHGVAGGSVGAAFNKRWAVLFEYSHLRMGSAGYSELAPLRIYEFQGISNSRANHFSLGTHFNLPARGRRFIPVGLRGIHRSEEHTSELQSHHDLVCRLLLEKKKQHT